MPGIEEFAAAHGSPLLALVLDPTRRKLIKQGAEAKAYYAPCLWPAPTITTSEPNGQPSVDARTPRSHGDLLTGPLLIKHRFPKAYRHAALSASITASRTQSEARVLVRCLRSGVNVPRLACLDEKEGIIGMEWIEGKSVREWLGGGAEGDEADTETPNDTDTGAETIGDDSDEEDEEELLSEEAQLKLMRLVGEQLARMHMADVVHGDLTTSNMMLRRRQAKAKAEASLQSATSARSIEGGVNIDDDDDLILIDFGLSVTSSLAEDKAVDLYVLERAFASTHPSSEHLFRQVLLSYAAATDLLWQEQQKQQQAQQNLQEQQLVSGNKGRPAQRATKNRGEVRGGARAERKSPWVETERRLKEVRLRGRKRDMTG